MSGLAVSALSFGSILGEGPEGMAFDRDETSPDSALLTATSGVYSASSDDDPVIVSRSMVLTSSPASIRRSNSIVFISSADGFASCIALVRAISTTLSLLEFFASIDAP